MEVINKYITLVTFVPWIFIYIKSIIDNLKKDNYKKFSFKYLRKNFFKVFRLDILLIVIVFFYFSSFKVGFVDKYLFAVMCLYMFVNSFYEEKMELKKNFFKDNMLHLILLLLVSLIPFLVYSIKKDLLLTYKIMLMFLFLEYIIILVISYIIKWGKLLFKIK